MMKASSLLILLSTGLSAGTAAWAADDEWQRCRQMPDPAARLACYDQIRLPPAAEAVRSPEAAVARFGLTGAAAGQEVTDAVESSLPGAFSGWQANTRLTLANGQVWQVVDGSSVYFVAQDPKVTVRRSALGAYYLDIAGLNTSPRVRRLK